MWGYCGIILYMYFFLVTQVYISMHSYSISNPNPVTLEVTLGIQPGKVSCKSNEVDSWIGFSNHQQQISCSDLSLSRNMKVNVWKKHMEWMSSWFLTSTCRRRSNSRGWEGLYSRSSGASLWIPWSDRGIGTRCHGGCRPLVVEAPWVHGNRDSGLGAGWHGAWWYRGRWYEACRWHPGAGHRGQASGGRWRRL